MSFHQCCTARLDVFCLVAIKAGGTDHLLQIRKRDLSKVFRCRQFLKQARGYPVDPFIRALGRQNRGDQKLHRIPVTEGRLDIRVGSS